MASRKGDQVEKKGLKMFVSIQSHHQNCAVRWMLLPWETHHHIPIVTNSVQRVVYHVPASISCPTFSMISSVYLDFACSVNVSLSQAAQPQVIAFTGELIQ
jgi:hypothetical protein